MSETTQADAGLSATLERALDHHRSGRYGPALALYQEILGHRPDDAGILVNHGIAALQAGRADLAIGSLTHATTVQPDMAQAHFNLANALQSCGRFREAAESYRRTLALDSSNAAAHNNLGVALQKSNRAREAIDSFKKALEIRADYAEALVNLSQTHRLLGEFDHAIAVGRRAIQLSPRHCEAHDCYGLAQLRAGQAEEAVSAFQAALSINPHFVNGQINLAKAWIHRGSAGAALEVLDACLAAHPGNIAALAAKSVALNEAGDREAFDRLMNCENLIVEFDLESRFEPGGLADFNRALAAHVQGHPTLTFEPEKNSTKGGFQSDNLLAEPTSAIKTLQRIIGDNVAAYVEGLVGRLQHPFLAKVPAQTDLRMWGVVLKSQGHQSPHIHPSGWISGCYYVRVPPEVATADDGRPGWIEFGRPHPVFGAKAEPAITRMQPQEGLMLLFPSFFYHATVPFESEDARISIAFDVLPCG